MAGAGVRLFTAGSQLLASQVNNYLMDQVVAYFADSAARDAAFGGIGEPVLAPGRVCYLFSDNKLYLYGNDSQWAEIGAQLDDLEVTTAKINDLAVTTGKIADSAVTSAKIADGTIVNADVNASAALALTKLATGTVGSVVLHNASGVPTATALSGDVTVNSSGVTAISSGVIVNADINASAAIEASKISGTAITAADTGTVTSTMILDGTIVNADINASAAIALSKLASGTSGQVVVANGSGVPTYVTPSGDVTLTNAGVTSIGSGKVTSAMIVDGTIVDTDISASAGIALTKVADITISTKTTSPYLIALGDKNSIIEMNLAGANIVNVPTNASTAFAVGTVINIVQYGAGKTQVVASTPGTTTIRATPGAYLRAQYSTASLIKRATDEWYLIGDLSAS